MFGIIPYRVDVPEDRYPVANWLLIVFTVMISISFFHSDLMPGSPGGNMVADGWSFYGLIGHMFLHGGVMHLGGNMLFLWLFGNAVCAKLNNFLYLPIYFLVGLASVSFFNIVSGGPLIGASGAINGIIGIYLIFFPLNDIDCLLLAGFGGIGRGASFTVSGFWMIILWFGFDMFGLFFNHYSMVAYAGHIGGFLAGLSLGGLMLKFKIVKMERYELSLIDVFQGKGRRRGNTLDPELDVLYKRRVGMLSDNNDKHVGSESNCGYAEHESVEEVRPKKRISPTVSVRDGKMYFHCECGNKIKVPESLMGKKAKCPMCNVKIDVPVINI